MVEPCATLSIENGNVKCLTRLLLEKLKNSIFEIPIIPQALNINNYRIASESLSTWISLEILSNTLLKNLWSKTMLIILLLLSRNCCLKWGCYYHPPSGVQGAKRLNFQWKNSKIFGFCWNYLKSDWLSRLEGFEQFYFFKKISLQGWINGKLKNSIFEIPIITQTLNINN